jgi:hypothetical protein
MPENEDDWTLKEWRSDTTPEVRLFRKNLSADIAGFRSTHGHLAYFTFAYTPKDDSGLPTTADFDRLAEIEESELVFLTDGELAAFVAVVTVSGIRDFLFYTHSPELFLARSEAIRDRHPDLQCGCQISPDPTWSQYDDLP